MKLLLKSVYIVSLLSITLFLSSCYPAHSGSGSGLLNGNGSGSGGTGGTGGNGGGGNNGTPTTFTVGGGVIGLTGTGLILDDNGSDDLPITANGTFTFKTSVSGAYSVVVKTQPTSPTQNCTVSNATGTAVANVTNVLINCGTTGLTVGGSVSGLIGGGLVLQNNGGNNITVSGQGNVPFTFSTPLSPGAAYAVTILTQPSKPAQVCSVVNGSGTVTSNVTNVEVICTQPGFTISGSVVGLVEGPGDTLEEQDNAGDDLFVTGDTTFTFPTQVTNGGIYNVQTFLFPTSQPQGCTNFFYTGIATTNVSTVLVDCEHNDWGWNSWYLDSTTKANNYGAVTTPLQPPNTVYPPDLGTPGGRDFAASWTDKFGRRWLFGGNGFPYPSPLGNQLPSLLNDLWVYDPFLNPAPGWVPANLPTFTDAGSNPPVFKVRVGPLEEEDVLTGSTPGSRWGSSSWTDNSSGDLYLFGGQGIGSAGGDVLLNDLWKCTPGASVDINGAGTSSCPWTFVGGSTAGDASGVYISQGVSGGGRVPGGRWAAATTTDASGHVWLFGGQGVDSAGTIGLLNDLWEFTGGQWTWIGPSTSNVANQIGIYPNQRGSGSGMTAPGGRQASVLWTDVSGNIWLFGGFGLDSKGTGNAGPPPAGAILNDLWEYNIATKQWNWVSGSNLANQTGNFGAEATSNLSTGAAANFPGSRWGAVGWSDTNSNLWLFGGWGYGTSTTDPTGFLDDIWEYQHSSGQWIWWKGISNANQNTVFAIKAIPGGDNAFFVQNVVGGRRGAAIWAPNPVTIFDYIHIFGGEGYDSSNGAPPGYLNDQWTYLPFLN